VVELLHDVELVLEGIQSGGLLLVFLDGDQSALLVFSQLDPASQTKYCAW
jgi:hypothetical protein